MTNSLLSFSKILMDTGIARVQLGTEKLSAGLLIEVILKWRFHCGPKIPDDLLWTGENCTWQHLSKYKHSVWKSLQKSRFDPFGFEKNGGRDPQFFRVIFFRNSEILKMRQFFKHCVNQFFWQKTQCWKISTKVSCRFWPFWFWKKNWGSRPPF